VACPTGLAECAMHQTATDSQASPTDPSIRCFCFFFFFFFFFFFTHVDCRAPRAVAQPRATAVPALLRFETLRAPPSTRARHFARYNARIGRSPQPSRTFGPPKVADNPRAANYHANARPSNRLSKRSEHKIHGSLAVPPPLDPPADPHMPPSDLTLRPRMLRRMQHLPCIRY